MAGLSAVAALLLGLDEDDLRYILRAVDHPVEKVCSLGFSRTLDQKGFWRVGKSVDPELRETVLTLVAFRHLMAILPAAEGRNSAIQEFLNGESKTAWRLPQTLRLADFDLGHDARAKRPQSVESRLGPRFYKWQIEQDPEESWRECHIHARNLLGEARYQQLLKEIETGDRNWQQSSEVAEPKGGQGSLFGAADRD